MRVPTIGTRFNKERNNLNRLLISVTRVVTTKEKEMSNKTLDRDKGEIELSAYLFALDKPRAI